jgi:YD repeat-containing protein
MGQTVQAAYDALNRKTIEVDANGALATWKYTYFGQLAGHSDIGGANYAYSYDNARQLTQQTSTRGQNLAYSHDAAGQLVRIDDAGVGKTSTYAYDLSGRRLRETTVQGGVTYQDNHIAYDALGRMRWVADTRAYLRHRLRQGGQPHPHRHPAARRGPEHPAGAHGRRGRQPALLPVRRHEPPDRRRCGGCEWQPRHRRPPPHLRPERQPGERHPQRHPHRRAGRHGQWPVGPKPARAPRCTATTP